MAARVHAGGHNLEAAAVTPAPDALEEGIDAVPQHAGVRIAFDRLMRDRPRFLVAPPADHLDLDAVVLDVDPGR